MTSHSEREGCLLMHVEDFFIFHTEFQILIHKIHNFSSMFLLNILNVFLYFNFYLIFSNFCFISVSF